MLGQKTVVLTGAGPHLASTYGVDGFTAIRSFGADSTFVAVSGNANSSWSSTGASAGTAVALVQDAETPLGVVYGSIKTITGQVIATLAP